MRDISVIVPVFQLSGQRLRNFLFILERLINASYHEILVVEQLPHHKENSDLQVPDKARHVIVHSGSNVIEKSTLVNQGVLQSTGEFIQMNDADIYFPYHIVSSIVNEDDVFVNPFRYFVMLNNAQTTLFMEKGRVTVMNGNALNALAAGSFIMRKKEYIACRGMDESFVGWGYEDSEFGDRVRHLFPVRIIEHIEGVHLFHPHRMRVEPATIRERNYKKYVNNVAMLKKNPMEALENIQSPFRFDPAFFV